MNYNLIFLFILLNLPFFFLFKNIAKIINIFDAADGIRKFQKKSIPLIGGFILIYNLLSFFILDFFFELKIFDEKFTFSNKEFFSLYIGSILFFLFGVLDDKYSFKANIKLFIIFILTLLVVMLDKNLLITNLKFSFISHIVELDVFSYFLSILCFLLFFNALNMFDGINLQVGFYSVLIFIIFIIKGLFVNLSLIIIVSLLFFLLFNYKSKTFLGEGGVQLLAFLISYIIIKAYNLEKDFFYVDEIFIIMAIPGLELFRLFLVRLLNGKHPFKGDTNHLHHLLIKRFSPNNTFLLTFISIVISINLYYLVDSKLIYILCIILFYSIIIHQLSKKE